MNFYFIAILNVELDNARVEGVIQDCKKMSLKMEF